MSEAQNAQHGETDRKKRPASQYYWGDWWKDKGLHSCSLTARGLWHEMNCLMHDGEPYGHLTLNGRPMTVAQLANQCRISASQCAKLLRELEDAGVPSRTPDGVYFSRRMVRDEASRNARAEGGKLGAEHGSKGAEHGSKGGRPAGSKGGSETPLDAGEKPPPSSSSSASAVNHSVPDGTGAAAPPTDRDVVFAAGVAMLTAAGVEDKNARSFLAMQCKAHGEATVRAALNRCAEERPIQPIPWLQAALKGKPAGPVKSKFIADREAQASRWIGTAVLPGMAGEIIDMEAASHGATPAIR